LNPPENLGGRKKKKKRREKKKRFKGRGEAIRKLSCRSLICFTVEGERNVHVEVREV